jgi:hypothetical protein
LETGAIPQPHARANGVSSLVQQIADCATIADPIRLVQAQD